VGDVKGTRHKARVVAAYLLGGYVGGGLLSHSEARRALEDVVRLHTSNFTAAMQTIDDCLEAGESEPITYEMKEAERRAYLGQKAQKSTISISTDPPRKPENGIRLERPARPTITIPLPRPTRSKISAEVAG
jgi:hypothetical protein